MERSGIKSATVALGRTSQIGQGGGEHLPVEAAAGQGRWRQPADGEVGLAPTPGLQVLAPRLVRSQSLRVPPTHFKGISVCV